MQGEVRGSLEVMKTPLWKARLETSIRLPNDWPQRFPNFSANYNLTQHALSRGIFNRRQMPVITTADLERLKVHLQGQVPSFHVMFNPKHLTPLQSQLYLSKMLDYMQERGVDQSMHDTHDNPILVSADRHIVDGHHRWGETMLLGVDVPAYEIRMDATELLHLALSLSDQEKHARNA